MPHRLALLLAQPGEAQGRKPEDLFGNLLDRFMDIVGPQASEATFRYASLQEGLRLGAGYGPRQLASAIARVDGILSHRSRIVGEDKDAVRIAVEGSELLAGSRVRQAVVLGLLEGVLRAALGHAYNGRVLAGPEGPSRVLEFTRAP